MKKSLLILVSAACCISATCGGRELLRNAGFYEAGINKRVVPRWWDVKSADKVPAEIKVKMNKAKHELQLHFPGGKGIVETHFYRILCSSLDKEMDYKLTITGTGKGSVELKFHTYNDKGAFLKTIDIANFAFDNGASVTLEGLPEKLSGAVRFMPAFYIAAKNCTLSGISLKSVKKKAVSNQAK